jgi:type IV/VI secretion system ImpK/VasF family protein
MHDDVRWTRVQIWKPVREVFQAADELFEDAERLRRASEDEPAGLEPPPGSATPTPTPPAPPGAAAPAARGRPSPPPGRLAAPPAGAPAAYARRRRAVREAIEAQLDPVFTDQLGLWQKHMCVIAVVSYIDERERVLLGPLADTWQLPLLQDELLGIDDGGDRFFTQLQELLARADVHEMVFELHLLCLRAGFVGRYRDRRHELEKLTGWITHRLRQHVPRRPAMVVAEAPAAPARRRIGFIQFPLRYYLGTGVALVAVFGLLRVLSSREVERSNLADYCHYHDGDAP